MYINGPIKAANCTSQMLLGEVSVSDIAQVQDLQQSDFMSSLNWDVGQAIKNRKDQIML